MRDEPAQTIRDAKWDEAYRGVEYLFRKGIQAQRAGDDVVLKVPGSFACTMAEAILHMANHTMPLYRLHADVEAYSRSMVAQAAVAEETLQAVVCRAGDAVAEMESLLRRYGAKPARDPGPKPRWPIYSVLSFGG